MWHEYICIVEIPANVEVGVSTDDPPRLFVDGVEVPNAFVAKGNTNMERIST